MAESLIPQDVVAKRQTAESFGETLKSFAEVGPTITDQLDRIIKEALDYNKDVIEMRSSALSDYLAAPAQSYALYSAKTLPTGEPNPNFVFDPFLANKAIADFIKTSEVPFLTANTLLGMRQGQESEMVKAGTRAFQAQHAAAQSAYEAARQSYTDTLNEFQTSEDIRLKEMNIRKSGGGGFTPGQAAGLVDKIIQDAYDDLQLLSEKKGELNTDDVEQVWQGAENTLKGYGLDPTQYRGVIDTARQRTESYYEPMANFQVEDIQQPEPEQKGFFGGIMGKISDFLNVGQQTVAPTAGPQPGPTPEPTNLKRGMSNVSDFLSGFNFGEPTQA